MKFLFERYCLFDRNWIPESNIFKKLVVLSYIPVGLIVLTLKTLINLICYSVFIFLHYMGFNVGITAIKVLRFVCGFVYFYNDKKKLLSEGRIIVANHCTMADHLAFLCIENLYFISRVIDKQNLIYRMYYPFMKDRLIELNHKNPTELANEVKSFLDKNPSAKVLIFPEGTIGTDKHLYHFHSFAFSLGRYPIQLVGLTYHPILPFLRIYPFMCSQLLHLLFLIAQVFSFYRIQYVDIVFPSMSMQGKISLKDAQTCAKDAQIKIARRLQFIDTLVTDKDKKVMRQYYEEQEIDRENI